MRWILATLLSSLGFWSVASAQPSEDILKLELEQAEQTLKKAQIKPETPELLEFFQKRTLSPEDEAILEQLVFQLGNSSYSDRALATAKLLKAGSLATPFLQKGLKADDYELVRRAELCLRHITENSDADIIIAAALLLGHTRPEGAAKALLDYLPFATDDEVIRQVREAVTKVAVRDNQPEPVVLDALKDRFPIRRAAAGEALAKLDGQRDRVLALLKDPEPQVRLLVSLALLRAKDTRPVPVLIELLEQLPEDDVWQAEETLLRLAGESAPTVEPAQQDKNGKVRKAWEQWLKGHANDLNKLVKDFAEGGSFLNYILVTQMPMQGGPNGEVFEMGPKNKVMWTVNNLRYPVDAHVIGPQRVLIAEYLNRRVIEVDFKGNVKWSYEIDQPVGCQLLPNGNIFIASRRELVEVTRDHKKKFSYTTPALYISTARKLPNGDVLLVDNKGKLTHLDPKGNVKHSFMVGRVYTLGGHIDVLPGNRVLVPEYTNHRVAEYSLKGELKWEKKVNWPTCAVRLPNGQTLVTSMINQQVLKLDSQGNTVWSYKTTGRPWCARAR
jgi:hypothetical protein